MRQGFLLCRELEDAGYWKTEALSREEARHLSPSRHAWHPRLSPSRHAWHPRCEVNGLTECDYMPVFGLWDLRERSSLGCCQ